MRRTFKRFIALFLFSAVICGYLSVPTAAVAEALSKATAVVVTDSFTDFGIAASECTKLGENIIRVSVKTEAGNEADFTHIPGAQQIIQGPDGYYVIAFSSLSDAESFTESEEAMQAEYAEIENKVSVLGRYVSDISPSTHSSWGVAAIEADVFAEYIKNRGIKTEVIVAVVDTGIAPHERLDDIVIQGYDFVDGDDFPTNDGVGHGTHVAGIIADCTMGTNIKIMSIRTLDNTGNGDDIDTANGIRYAADNGAKVINLSLGGRHDGTILEDAIDYAIDKDCSVVVAAGNGEYNLFTKKYVPIDTEDYCPAHIEEAITVTMIDSSYVRASNANRGNEVDVAAPGIDILSTSTNNEFCELSGTSMAVPHVSACAALLKAVHPEATPAEIQQMIKDTSMDLGDIGFDIDYGYGVPKMSGCIPKDYSLKSIQAAELPKLTEYYIGDSLNADGLAVMASYADSTEFLVNDYTLSYDFSTAGERAVTVTYTENGISASTVFDVRVKNPAVNLSSDTVLVAVDGTKSITVTTDPPNLDISVGGSGEKFSKYSVEDNTITFSGRVEGEEIYSISFVYNKITYTEYVTVIVDKYGSLEISKEPKKLIYYIGDTFNPDGLEVGLVGAKGDVTAITDYTLSDVDMNSSGEKTVTITHGTGRRSMVEKFTIGVYTPYISATASSRVVRVGESVDITYDVSPPEGGSVLLRSENGCFAFSADGKKATAIKEGTDKITAVLVYNSIEYLSEFNLYAIRNDIKIESVSIYAPSTELEFGKNVQLTANVLPDEIPHSVSWSSSDYSIATVDENGLVTALGSGKVTITATVSDDKGNEFESNVEINCTMSFWQFILNFFRSFFSFDSILTKLIID